MRKAVRNRMIKVYKCHQGWRRPEESSPHPLSQPYICTERLNQDQGECMRSLLSRLLGQPARACCPQAQRPRPAQPSPGISRRRRASE